MRFLRPPDEDAETNHNHPRRPVPRCLPSPFVPPFSDLGQWEKGWWRAAVSFGEGGFGERETPAGWRGTYKLEIKETLYLFASPLIP